MWAKKRTGPCQIGLELRSLVLDVEKDISISWTPVLFVFPSAAISHSHETIIAFYRVIFTAEEMRLQNVSSEENTSSTDLLLFPLILSIRQTLKAERETAYRACSIPQTCVLLAWWKKYSLICLRERELGPPSSYCTHVLLPFGFWRRDFFFACCCCCMS